jgi:hypothetical protein
LYSQPAEIELDVTVPPLEFQDNVAEPHVIELGESTETGESIDSNESAGERDNEDNSNENNDDSDDEDDDPNMPPLQTRSGRAVNQPSQLIEEIGATATGTEAEIYEIKLSNAEIDYYETMQRIHEGEFISDEIVCVGAGLGGGFVNTNELKVLKYKDAMETEDWK